MTCNGAWELAYLECTLGWKLYLEEQNASRLGDPRAGTQPRFPESSMAVSAHEKGLEKPDTPCAAGWLNNSRAWEEALFRRRFRIMLPKAGHTNLLARKPRWPS